MRALQTLTISLIALCGACQAPRGGEGQSCNYKGDLFNGSFICNTGLVCVSYGSLCVRLHSEPAGGPCEVTNDPCVVGLICAFKSNAWQCADPLGAGEVCGADTDCANGLVCLKGCDKSIESECLVPDATKPCRNLQDAGDAMMGDGMGSIDAGQADGDAEGGADF